MIHLLNSASAAAAAAAAANQQRSTGESLAANIADFFVYFFTVFEWWQVFLVAWAILWFVNGLRGRK